MSKKTIKPQIDPLELLGLVVCNCGLVWHLKIMKENQFDWERVSQKAKCVCGTVLYREKI